MARFRQIIGDLVLGLVGLVSVASVILSVPTIASDVLQGNAWLHDTLSSRQGSILGGIGLGIALAVFVLEVRSDSRIRRRVAALAIVGAAGSLAVIVSPFARLDRVEAPEASVAQNRAVSGPEEQTATNARSAGHGSQHAVVADGPSNAGTQEAGSADLPAEASAAQCSCSSVKYVPPSQPEANGRSGSYEEPFEEEPFEEEPFEEEPYEEEATEVRSVGGSQGAAAAAQAEAQAAGAQAQAEAAAGGY